MGKIEVTVNSDFKGLTRLFAALPSTFEKSGTLLYKGRNTVRLIDFDGESLVVKRFRTLTGIKKIIYRFRQPKATRSYRHALMLLDLGISTPMPAAYAVVYDNKKMPCDSFYVSRYTPLPPLKDFFGTDENFDRGVIDAFALFVAKLHRHGILFDDLNNTNVLVEINNDGNVSFTLIDINRMRFKHSRSLTVSKRFRNISRFCYDMPALFEYFVEKYIAALISNNDLQESFGPELDKELLKAKAIEIKAAEDRARRRLHRIKHPFRKN